MEAFLMKRFGGVVALLIISLLFIFMTGCTGNDNSASGSKKKNSSSANSEKTAAVSEEKEKKDEEAADSPAKFSAQDNVSEEQKNTMVNLTGNWESLTPLSDGNTSVVRAKIDNVSGFTLTTGVQNPDGKGSFYSRVGSYSVEGNQIVFSATTGGQSDDGSSYSLKTDPGVFKYTFTENPELTQITLTPTNDGAKQLTGEGTITLNKI